MLGNNNSYILLSSNLLRSVLTDLGKYSDTELMHRQTLATSKRVLSLDYLDTLTTINNLAEVLVS